MRRGGPEEGNEPGRLGIYAVDIVGTFSDGSIEKASASSGSSESGSIPLDSDPPPFKPNPLQD